MSRGSEPLICDERKRVIVLIRLIPVEFVCALMNCN